MEGSLNRPSFLSAPGPLRLTFCWGEGSLLSPALPDLCQLTGLFFRLTFFGGRIGGGVFKSQPYLHPWLVRPANESDCTVTVFSFHVKRVLTRSDCADLDADFFLVFFGRARRDVGGEGKSCRPPLSISHVPLLFVTYDVFLASTCPPEKNYSFRF